MTDEEYDERLWFEHEGCEGKHFLIGNPHTFKGRMWAWCPVKKCTFFLAISEIGNKSIESKYWIEGFLHGAEPDPPQDQNGITDYESSAYSDWKEQCVQFRTDGRWTCVNDGQDTSIN